MDNIKWWDNSHHLHKVKNDRKNIRKYLVYKLTSPSGKVYIGYTGNTLEKRIKVHINDRNTYITNGRTLPIFYASLSKYPIHLWKREIVHSELSKPDAQLIETQIIEQFKSTDTNFGYNMALGGNGGNTGRNGEEQKRKQHAEFMRNLHKSKPNQASESGKKNWENCRKNGSYTKRCQAISDKTPRGKDHWNFTGYWVVRHNKYETLKEAILHEHLSEGIVLKYCNNPDITFYRKTTICEKGQTPRDLGFYRILKEQ